MKILICDDDGLNLKLNQVMVEDYLEKSKIQNAEIITRNKINLDTDLKELDDVDIAILDVDLNDEINGLNIAKAIKKCNPYVAVVFITSYDSYALDAWKLQSFGFLQKPVDVEAFKQIFQKIILQINGLRITRMNRMIHLNSQISVRERDIFCIEKITDTKDVKVTTNKEVHIFRGTIKEVEKLLGKSFIRISRNTIINMHYIYKMEKGVVELSNEKTFFVTPAKIREIKAFYSQIKV